MCNNTTKSAAATALSNITIMWWAVSMYLIICLFCLFILKHEQKVKYICISICISIQCWHLCTFLSNLLSFLQVSHVISSNTYTASRFIFTWRTFHRNCKFYNQLQAKHSITIQTNLWRYRIISVKRVSGENKPTCSICIWRYYMRDL